MKTINGITYLEPGEKHPNADKTDKKKGRYKFLENNTTAARGHFSKSHLRKMSQKGTWHNE